MSCFVATDTHHSGVPLHSLLSSFSSICSQPSHRTVFHHLCLIVAFTVMLNSFSFVPPCSPSLPVMASQQIDTATPQSPVMAKISTKRNVRKPLETNPQLCFPLSRSVPAGAVSSQRGCRHGGESRRAGQLRV